MNGKLAGIYKGITQIGGLTDWALDVNLVGIGNDTYKLASWKLTAQGYWFFDLPNTELTIKLFADIGKGYWEGQGKIHSEYMKIFNTLIHAPIEILGYGVLEGKCLPNK